jgi:hypothetical protein
VQSKDQIRGALDGANWGANWGVKGSKAITSRVRWMVPTWGLKAGIDLRGGGHSEAQHSTLHEFTP